MTRYRDKIGMMLGMVGLVALLSTPAHAIFGFGVHGGLDFTSFDEKQFAGNDFVAAAAEQNIQGFNSALWSSITLTREKIGNPYLIGAHVYFDFIPVVDLEASVDVSIQKYKVNYYSSLNNSVNESVDAYFGRVGAYVTARKDLIDLPMFAFYMGGGLGMHFVAPVASDEFIVSIYGSDNPNESKPNIKDNISRDTTLGYHALTGVRFKPPIIPLAFRIEGKYTNTGASGMDRPGSVMSVYFGTSIDF